MIIKIHAIVSKADTNGVNLFIAEVAEISNKYMNTWKVGQNTRHEWQRTKVWQGRGLQAVR